MMDGAYFVGRKELIDFFNDTLGLKLTKIEQTASGAVACQLTEMVFPNSIPLSRINWQAKSDYEYVQNYKLLQVAFTKNRVQRHVDVDKLIRAKYQDNLEFCQWLKAFYDQAAVYREDYDPIAARAKGKGGAKYNQQMANAKPGSMARSRPAPTRAAPSSRPAPSRPTAPKPAVPKPASPTSSRPSRPLRERANETAAAPAPSVDHMKELAEAKAHFEKEKVELQARIEELEQQEPEPNDDVPILEAKVLELEQAVLDIEKERDFYFEKLRNVEVLLQVHQDAEEKDPEALVSDVFQILYAAAEDNLIVTEDGKVMVAEEEE